MREIAARLDREADELRRHAETVERSATVKRESERRARVIHAAAMRSLHGASDPAIIDGLCRTLNLTPSDAKAVLADERTHSRAALKAQRNRLILIQAWKGWTNAKIAAHHGLSENHVSRLVARRLRTVDCNDYFGRPGL